MKKKFLFFLLIISFVITLSGCSKSEEEVLEDLNNEIDKIEEKSNSEDDIELYSDDTKIVFATENGMIVFYYEDDRITAYHAYLNYNDSTTAKYALDILKMSNDETIENAYVKGKYVVLEYKESEYENMSLEDVKLTYSYLKEIKNK